MKRTVQGRTHIPVTVWFVLSAAVAAAPLDPAWLESFDAAWRILRDTYYDTTFKGHDWEAVRRELRPEAESAGSPEEIRKVIRAMLARLGDSHLTLLPGGAAPGADAGDASGDPGLEVRELQDGDVVVVRVLPGSGAEAAGVQPGWVLRAIDGAPALRAEATPRGSPGEGGSMHDTTGRLRAVEMWRWITGRLRGPIGSRAKLLFLDGRDRPREVSVERRAEKGEPIHLGVFPTMFVRTERRALQAPAGGRVGYLRFNVWLTPVDGFVSEAVNAFRSADGMVIDLRGNPGGLAAMLMGVAGHFVSDRVSLGEMRTREGTLRFFANPRFVAPDGRRVSPFSGRLAILVDELTGSASECFAGGMQAIGRARLFGARTMGQALPALFDTLPSGDVLVHAYADFVTATGVRLEGEGVRPDVEVPWSREALVEGRDTALERAAAWAGSGR